MAINPTVRWMCDSLPPQIRILWKKSSDFLAVLLAPTQATPAGVGYLMARGTTQIAIWAGVEVQEGVWTCFWCPSSLMHPAGM